MTTVATFCSHIILQKSAAVSSFGPVKAEGCNKDLGLARACALTLRRDEFVLFSETLQGKQILVLSERTREESHAAATHVDVGGVHVVGTGVSIQLSQHHPGMII